MHYNAAYQAWEATISNGNDCFFNHQMVIALAHYLRAVDLSETLLEQRPCSRQSIGAMLVSYHNLADLYVADNCIGEAWATARKAQQLVLALTESYGSNDNLLWGQRIAHRQLCFLQKEYGEDLAFLQLGSAATTAMQVPLMQYH